MNGPEAVLSELRTALERFEDYGVPPRLLADAVRELAEFNDDLAHARCESLLRVRARRIGELLSKLIDESIV